MNGPPMDAGLNGLGPLDPGAGAAAAVPVRASAGVSGRVTTSSVPGLADLVPVPAWLLGAMVLAQLGSALAVPLMAEIGPAAATWLRMSWAALVLLLVARPRALTWSWRERGLVLGLGLASGGMGLCYFESVARLPLGTANAIEFLGPLGVALAGSRRRLDLAWVVLAAAGVLLLTGAASGRSAAGIGFSLVAAVCWAGYIVLTRRVGSVFRGLEGLAVSLAIAAIVTAPLGLAGGWHRFRPLNVLEGAGIALLMPLGSYAIEMAALRRTTARSFGILMSLEPAVSALIGFLVLGQHMRLAQLAGMACVVAASTGVVLSARAAPGEA